MEKDRWTVWAGPLTIAVGVLWLVASMGELVLLLGLASTDTFWDSFWFFPIVLSFIAMVPAFGLTRRRYGAAAVTAGRLGLLLSLAGVVGMWVFGLAGVVLGLVAPALGEGTWPNYAIAACVFSILLGHLLFGLAALRQRLLPRWNGLPLLVALPVLVLSGLTLIRAMAAPRDPQWVLTTTFLGFALTGLGWVLLGLAMRDSSPAPEPALANA